MRLVSQSTPEGGPGALTSRALPGIESLGDLAGARVLVRCDLNVPLDGGVITDDGRIRASLPTLEALLDADALPVIVAHLGRPGGRPDPAYTLEPVAHRLGELLERRVTFLPYGVETDAGLVLRENLRFHPGETSKVDAERGAFAAALAAGMDAYVDDAFGAVHRKHASVYDVAHRLPCAAGDLVRREVDVLRRLTDDPQRPYVVVLGGSKVSDKLAVIEHLLPTVDRLLVGGGMCFTFLAAQGYAVGDSLLEPDQLDACRSLLDSGKVVLPLDVVAAADVSADAGMTAVSVDAIADGQKGLDIGPQTVDAFRDELADAATVFWNGPMGVFELPPFASGTRGLAQAVADLDAAFTVVGGGDSAAAIRQLGIAEAAFSHISTGGGSSLEYLEGRSLPGLTVLEA